MGEINKTWYERTDVEKRQLDLVGCVSGSLTVTRFHSITDAGYDRWEVECECGTTTIKDGRNLRKPNPVRSCGYKCPFKGRKD